MNNEAFSLLVDCLENLGAPYSLPSDPILCTDLDVLRDLPTGTVRRRWLHNAKKETTRRAIQARVDEIIEARDCDDQITVGVLRDAFPHDVSLFPYLSKAERRRWCIKATDAAFGKGERDNPTVYVLGGIDGKFFKIGFTNNLQERMRSLQTAFPGPLHLYLAIPAEKDVERKLHDHFSAYRAHGEWFKRCAPILQFIDSNGQIKQSLD